MHRSLLAAVVLLAACAGLTVAVRRGEGQAPAPPPPAAARVLPGVQPSGAILLPNQWSLRPAGRQIVLGDFPVNLAPHPSNQWMAVLHSGYAEHEVMIVDLKKQKVVSKTVLDQTFYGLSFAPDGKRLFASGGEFEVVHAFDFADGLLSNHKQLAVAKPTDRFVVAGVVPDAKGRELYVAGPWGSAVCILPIDDPDKRITVEMPPGSYPYTCLPDKEGKRLFVSLWSGAAVAIIDLEGKKVAATWPTEPHPTEMTLSPDGQTLYVACANSTRVSVLNAADGKGVETISCSLYPALPMPTGPTPNSLSLTPDGEVLLVANADTNNVAVFRVAEVEKKDGKEVLERIKAKPMGFIPVGWYPTSVRFNPADKRVYVANGKGTSSFANVQGPQPGLPRNLTLRQYIGSLFRGTLAVIDMPSPERMAAYSKQAYACSPLRPDGGPVGDVPADNPVPRKVGDPSPIKHCIYIIKENRTYDQVFGDIKEGNGDPSLCIFPDKITPNHHKLAREFVLLDNFYVEGEVSADGHEWSMGAYCTDFVEKVWPLNYRGSPLKKLTQYPSEGEKDRSARPAGGYIWDRCAEAGVSYYSYGEWIENGPTPDKPGKARVKALEGHFDPGFRGYDLDYTDQKRADRFIEELKRYEKEGKMPRFIVMRLPNDHTYGTRAGKPTPTAMVADNDLALGRVVEAISKSKFWKETAIFVVEDDAQNGPDHVDAHRTVALVISPYTKRKFVDSTMYSTASMLRTMELILGLKPMSQFDAAARPMYHSFTAKADAQPYEHLVPQADLNAKNPADAWGAKLSETFDLTKEDAADDLLFNEVIWRSVKGAHSPMPPPVRAAFVFPHLKEHERDD